MEKDAAPDTLVVVPYRGIMAEYEPWELFQTNLHVATTFPDTPASRINTAFLASLEKLKAAGIPYDLTDERTLETDGKVVWFEPADDFAEVLLRRAFAV